MKTNQTSKKFVPVCLLFLLALSFNVTDGKLYAFWMDSPSTDVRHRYLNVASDLATALHVDGRYILNDNDEIVYLRGGWMPIFEDTCNARCALSGEEWNSYISTTTWRANAVTYDLEQAVSWGFTSLASFIWIDWWLVNAQTELGYTNTTIVTDRPYQTNIADFLDLAYEEGIYLQIRPYGVEAGYGGVGEGRVNFPFPVPGESYTHDGHILKNASMFADFWYNVSYTLYDKPNVIYNLYDEPVISYSNVDYWFDAVRQSIIKIRQAETERNGYTHLIQIHWGFCGAFTWVADWMTYVASNPVDLTNVIYSNHVYRDQGWGAEDTYGVEPYPYDYETQKAILYYQAGDSRIPDYPSGFSRKPYGRAWQYIIDTYNIAVVATAGANTGWSNEQEYQAFVNTLQLLNELSVGYWAYVWWRTGMIWSLVNDTTVPSPANIDGIALQNAIAGSSPPSYSMVAYNTTVENQKAKFSVKWQSSKGMSGFKFSWNETGTWANATWLSLGGSSIVWANVTYTLPEHGTKLGFRWYANDTSNIWTATPIYVFTVTQIGQQYFADLSQSLTMSLQILIQSAFNLIPTQSMTTTWNILTQSSFNIISIFLASTSWVILSEVPYTADLTLTVTISWVVNIIFTEGVVVTTITTTGLVMVAFVVALTALVRAIKETHGKRQ